MIERLPPNTIVIDFLRYTRFKQDTEIPGKKGASNIPSYTAFVLQANHPVKRVELGDAATIDQAVTQWRTAIGKGQTTHAATELRKLVWEPLEKVFQSKSKELQTIYLCPDGTLTSLPWVALPGRKGGALLEEYQLATLPHAHLLLDQLTTKQDQYQREKFLLVGDVIYNKRLQLKKKTTPSEDIPTYLAATTQSLNRGGSWGALKGTKQEVEDLSSLLPEKQISSLTGLQASTTNVLTELPKARWAHLATHGFFADAKFRSMRQMQDKNFAKRSFMLASERKSAAGRNPLTLSGLVLAGANVPRKVDTFGIPQGDDGILTAEAISGMNLQGLELAVLSACKTGLGDVAGGEGVFGLTRSFHTAGTRNVVASLWNVSDEATLAQMKLFYHFMRKEKLPPIEALRKAQLYIYRHPQEIPRLAKSRGIDVTNKKLPPDNQNLKQTTNTKLWAAFLLSGSGR